MTRTHTAQPESAIPGRAAALSRRTGFWKVGPPADGGRACCGVLDTGLRPAAERNAAERAALVGTAGGARTGALTTLARSFDMRRDDGAAEPLAEDGATLLASLGGRYRATTASCCCRPWGMSRRPLMGG
jgi:hypothetical protein